MRKNTAESIANEMAAAGYKPILAQAKRDGLPQTWEVWGVEPSSQDKVTIRERGEWEQRKQQEARP